MIKRLIAILFVLSLGVGPTLAQDKSQGGKKVEVKASAATSPSDLKDYADRAQNSAAVVRETMGISENGIPEDLMSRARAVMVIPHMVKAALGIGGRFGKGLVSERMANGRWGPPSFIEAGGGSFGLQLGADATDLVLVFTNREGMDSLLKGKLKLGADAGVSAGPVGRKAEIGTDVLLKSGIFAYSRSKGLFAGIALDGTVVTIDDSANAKVYGKTIDAQTVLTGKVQSNATVSPFVDALDKYAAVLKQTKK